MTGKTPPKTRKMAILGVSLTFCLLLFCPNLWGYSVLSHEALIDAAWDPFIVPLLRKRYPGVTPAQIQEAHAYAYGGSVIQDMGYYPFGNRFFSNLAHYVRGGVFIEALLRDSQNVNDYAFALGALSHYVADNNGHPIAVNLSVPMMYPRLHRKYGAIVTYEDDPKAHIMVEFSFDVAEIAGAGYLPRTYSNFIGFKVPKPLLERAFQETYGLNFKDLFLSEDLAIGTYRRGASEIIPRLTQIAWKEKKSEIRRADRRAARRKFVYRLSRGNYERQYGRDYRQPRFFLRRWTYRAKFGARQAQIGILARIMVFLFELLPKVGPLRTLAFKPPTPQTQRLFVKSFSDVVGRYETLLSQVNAGRLTLEEKNFDTGKLTQAGAYHLADQTYAELLSRLAKQRFAGVTPGLRNDILAYYANPSAPIEVRKNDKQWQTIQQNLAALKSLTIQASIQ